MTTQLPVARLLFPLFAVGMLCVATCMTGTANAQSSHFGSVDDPSEVNGLAWWESETHVEAYGGFSLIGPQWRSMARFRFDARRAWYSVRLDAAARAGLYGSYRDDFNDWRDALRIVDHLRYTPRNSRTYVRLGPLDRARIGTGHLVNFFSSKASWDERSNGVEATAGASWITLEAITEDITEARLSAGRIGLRPFAASRGSLRTFEIGVSGVEDRSALTIAGARVHAWGADARFTAFQAGAFAFQPFASFAQMQDYGRGLLVGADLVNNNFIDLARLHVRLALHYNGSGFLPGYFGSLYTVQSLRADVLANDPAKGTLLAGLPLERVFRDNTVWTELRLHVFERFELWYQFLRHHGVQSLSEYHLRLYLNTDKFRLGVGQDRAGLDGFISLFDTQGNQNTLQFDMAYRVTSLLVVRAEARYTYIEAFETTEGRSRFLVQRRFEPLLGLRYDF